jgi:hypothetical protein
MAGLTNINTFGFTTLLFKKRSLSAHKVSMVALCFKVSMVGSKGRFFSSAGENRRQPD